jgi:hypothetical protein
MKTTKLASGLIVPDASPSRPQKTTIPERVYGRVEVKGSSDRAEVAKALSGLARKFYGSFYRQSLDKPETADRQYEAVMRLAEELLGQGIEFEMPC